jgi:hypothetical protein
MLGNLQCDCSINRNLPKKNSGLRSGSLWPEGVRTIAVYAIMTVRHGDNCIIPRNADRLLERFKGGPEMLLMRVLSGYRQSQSLNGRSINVSRTTEEFHLIRNGHHERKLCKNGFSLNRMCFIRTEPGIWETVESHLLESNKISLHRKIENIEL